MSVSTTYNLDRAALNEAMRGPQGPVWMDIRNRGTAVQNRAKAIVPVRKEGRGMTPKGRLKNSIALEMTLEGGNPTAVIGTTVEYAIYVHEGRGPVRPRTRKTLRFIGRGGQVVFAKQVRGVAARPFLKNALPAALKP